MLILAVTFVIDIVLARVVTTGPYNPVEGEQVGIFLGILYVIATFLAVPNPNPFSANPKSRLQPRPPYPTVWRLRVWPQR